MIYIFTALKSEAQALVDKYKLQKNKIDNYTIFKNKDMVVIITGIGFINCSNSCEFILRNYKVNSDDVFINIGICGASQNYKIGELVEIGKIDFDNNSFILNKTIDKTITCIDYEAKDNRYDLVDMESYGFYKSLNSYKNIFIFKIVSDHFEPQTITKDKTKMLLFDKLDNILKKIVSHSRL